MRIGFGEFILTRKVPLTRFKPCRFWELERQAHLAASHARSRCCFLFFLPLHVHFSISPQISNPCSCLHGARTQIVVAEDAPTLVAVPQFGVLLESQICPPRSITSNSQQVRGPPLAVSL